MLTKYDKAGAAAISTAITTLIMAFTTLDPEAVAAIGTLATLALTWAVPNKGVG